MAKRVKRVWTVGVISVVHGCTEPLEKALNQLEEACWSIHSMYNKDGNGESLFYIVASRESQD